MLARGPDGPPALDLGDLLYKLDANAPFVIDTRELGRRPGSQRTVSRTDPAPADLGIEVIGVPEGSPIDLDVRLEAVMEGVLVTGTVTVQVHGECARCLSDIEDITSVDIQELYVYDHVRTDADEDQETRRLVDDLLDSSPWSATPSCWHCPSSRSALTTAEVCARVWRPAVRRPRPRPRSAHRPALGGVANPRPGRGPRSGHDGTDGATEPVASGRDDE
jgi:hypothetical protein